LRYKDIMKKIYNTIEEASQEIYGHNNWGCESSWNESISVLREEFPKGQLIFTRNGMYWLWETEQE
jgi:hypothetical protein